MVEIDLELDGVGSLQSKFEELEQRAEDPGTYVVGTNVEYGVFLEFGTEDMPPYPFFRPAIREFKANPEQLIRRHTGFTSIDQIPNEQALVEAIANSLAEQMTNNASALSGGSRSPRTNPDHPMRQTGNLAASISATQVK